MGVEPKIGGFPENPIKIHDLEGKHPYFWFNTHIQYSLSILTFLNDDHKWKNNFTASLNGVQEQFEEHPSLLAIEGWLSWDLFIFDHCIHRLES